MDGWRDGTQMAGGHGGNSLECPEPPGIGHATACYIPPILPGGIGAWCQITLGLTQAGWYPGGWHANPLSIFTTQRWKSSPHSPGQYSTKTPGSHPALSHFTSTRCPACNSAGSALVFRFMPPPCQIVERMMRTAPIARSASKRALGVVLRTRSSARRMARAFDSDIADSLECRLPGGVGMQCIDRDSIGAMRRKHKRNVLGTNPRVGQRGHIGVDVRRELVGGCSEQQQRQGQQAGHR